MSFYTSLTGLNAATTELAVTSNNIANAGTNGFKRASADFGDIFASTPLQKASSITGSGVALNGIVQQHTQGNVQFSTNSLDLAITGDGYFKLKTSDGAELYTRNGGFMLNDQNQMVNSAGQGLQILPVDSINNANFEADSTGLSVPRTTLGEFVATTEISLGLNLPSSAKPITADFNANKPDTYHKTTAFTTYGANGNAQLATIYYVKTANPTDDVPYSKWQTYITIDGEDVKSSLTQSAAAGDDKQFINKYGEIKAQTELDALAKNPGFEADGVTARSGSQFLITAGTNYRKFSLDQLQKPTDSLTASLAYSLPTGSVYKDGLNLTNGSAGVDFGSAAFIGANTKTLSQMFDVYIDGSIKRPITLTRLLPLSVSSLPDKVLSGKEIAVELTNEINKAFGDSKPFLLNAVNNHSLRIKRTNNADPAVTATLALDVKAIVNTQHAIATNPHLRTGAAVAAVTDESEGWQIAYALTAHLNAQAGDAWSDIDVEYDEKNQGFVFHQTGAAVPDTLRIGSANAAAKTIYGVDPATADTSIAGTDGGSMLTNLTLNGSKQLLSNVFGNGTALVEASRRSGMKVDYAGGIFTLNSGTTGDSSSIKIIASHTLPALPAAQVPAMTVGGTMAGTLFGMDVTGTTVEAITSETKPVESLIENIPTVRGQKSTPAFLTGNAMGVDTGQAFNVTAANQGVTVVIDGVTATVKLALGQYNIDTFTAELQAKINLMSDANGKTINNIKVAFDKAKTALTITGSTATSKSFIQVIGSNDWGLEDVAVAFGKTSQYAKIDSDKSSGSSLYVTQDSATGKWVEGVDKGDFEANNLPYWTPIFLDRGEITFDTSGALVSPATAYEIESNAVTGTDMKLAYTGSTQYNQAFSAISTTQNGKPEGDLNGVSIGEDGLVVASYSNGSQKSLGKIVIANFNSSSGLKQIGNSAWVASAESGAARLGEAGAAGYGTIRAGARERSNVDLTNELVDLISAQRNFQANAKAIETNSAMTSAIINIRG